VRLALTRGLTRKQVADDLGVGLSTLNKSITANRDMDVVSKADSNESWLKRATGSAQKT
jgi:transposase